MNIYKTGFYSSLGLSVLTVITFGVAMTAVPIAGAFCPSDCIDYPYLDTYKQFPGDFLWMYFAIIQLIVFLITMVSVHLTSAENKKIFSYTGLIFSGITVILLAADYFVQVSVIPVSLKYGETEGIPLLIQYNPHGIFIALEELGYLFMSLSFIFFAPVFSVREKLQLFIKWIFILAFILTFLSFILITVKFGIDRKDRAEVVILSIDWLVLIVNGILLSILFSRLLKSKRSLTNDS